jgi:hypothetical protein
MRSRSPMENAMLSPKERLQGLSCLEPRLKLQVSLVQGRLAVILPSPVRSFGSQHANYTRPSSYRLTLLRNTISHSHPSRSNLSVRPVKAASCQCVAAMLRSSYRRQKADSMGLFSLLSVVNYLFLCCGSFCKRSFASFR